MSDDAFSRAARALHDSYDGSSPRAGATRRGLLARAAVERRRRRSFVAFLVPLAAALVLSTAWAAVTGRLSRWDSPRAGAPTGGARLAPGGAPGATEAPPAPPEVPSPPSPEVPPPAALLPTAAAPDPAAPDERSTAPDTRSTSRARAARSPAPPPASSAADPEESAYAIAHRAHFVDHDPALALKGWESYLAAYPRGRYALEARYNRALSLVRLGRNDDARAALAPFAEGTDGDYRKREARELLDAMASGHAR